MSGIGGQAIGTPINSKWQNHGKYRYQRSLYKSLKRCSFGTLLLEKNSERKLQLSWSLIAPELELNKPVLEYSDPADSCNPAYLLTLITKQPNPTNLTSLLGLLKDLLDDLLLLNQESTDNTVTNAVSAAGSTVGALDGLLWAGDLSVLAWAKGWDL